MKNNFFKLVNNILTSGKKIVNEDVLRLYQFINILLMVGAIYAVIFIPIQFTWGWYLNLTSNLILAISLSSIFIALRKGFRFHYAATLSVAILLAHFTFVSIIHPDPMMIIWFYVYPPIVIFLLGTRPGLFWSTISFFIFSGILISKVDFSPFVFRALMIQILIIIVVCFFEITRYKAHQERNRMQQNAINSSKFAMIGEMASGMAHEINNPMTVISGTTKIIRRKIKSINDHELKKSTIISLDKIVMMVMRVDKIIKNLKVFSKTTTNAKFIFVKISDLVDKATSLYRERLNHAKIDLDFKHGPLETGKIFCNETDILHVLISIINNAYEELSLQKINNKYIHIKVIISSRNIDLCISNNGKLIPKESKNKIFDPFFTTKENKYNIGLGLSISKSIMEKHDGNLLLETKPVTKFIVQFPIRDFSNIEDKQHT